MQLLDYLVIGLYALAMLAIGKYYKRQVQTSDDFLLGGRTMSPFMIGVSLFATLTSTLSYLAYPGEMIKYGPMIFAQLTSVPFTMLIVGWVLIPKFMKQDVTSGYELLETRLGIEGRMLGASLFLVLRTVWMASILFATTNMVLLPLLKIDQQWAPVISIVTGLVTLIYSSEGGMRAVVMTDALQSFIMLFGAIVVIVWITSSLGGVGAWWPHEWVSHWPRPVYWFESGERVTFAGAFLNYMIWLTCTAGSDQMAIQRYLSTRDAAAARRSFGFSLVTEVVQSILLGLVGLAVMGYFLVHHEALPIGKSLTDQADSLFSIFVVDVLPGGLGGLVIAAMLSAAMSSLSSGMNASSAIITTDFLTRFRRDPLSPQQSVSSARWASIGIGITAVVLSMVVGRLGDNLIELCFKVVNLLTAPLFTLFFLALFVPWARPLGAVAATIGSVSVAIGIAYGKWWGLEMLWCTPISFLVGTIVGSLVSLFVPIAPPLFIRNRD